MAHCPTLLFAGLILLSGCATNGAFPSLQYREIERRFSDLPRCGREACADDPDTDEQAAPPAPIADDPALGARIGALTTQAREGQRRFAAALPLANRAAGRAGAAGSESWIEAQQELSRLESARSDTVAALAELDALAVERRAAGTSASDAARIEGALGEVRGLVEAQRAEVLRLQERLSPR